MRTLVPLLLSLSAAAQMQPAALPLSTSTTTVAADLVLFRVDVLAPDGIWLETANSAGQWIYQFEAQWMSLLADQQPIQAGRWSLPEVHGGENAWHYGPVSQIQLQHLRPGSYLFAMADDNQETFRAPSPVVPVVAPTTFADANVAVTCFGYANVTGVNPALERPPFSANLINLQPCDMVGDFPYSTLVGGLPPVSVTWEAGAQVDTCSGFRHGPPPVGFVGACSRWILYNFAASTSHTAAVDLLLFRQVLATGVGSPLPDAIAGVVLLGLEGGAPSFVDVDLDALTGLFPDGGALRYLNLPVLWPLTWIDGANLRLQFAIGPDPSLVGVSMMLQAAAIDGAFAFRASDLYSITFR